MESRASATTPRRPGERRDPYAVSSRFSADTRDLSQQRTSVVMGPGVRLDDERVTMYFRSLRSTKQQFRLVSIGLLVQLRVWAAEVGRCRILADLDNAAADRAGAGEMLEQRLAVAAADRARQLGEVLVEGAEHLQDRFLVGKEHIAPHDRVGGGDAREVAK